MATTGHHRKYAIRLLRHDPPRKPARTRKRQRIYTSEVVCALTQIWGICDSICSRRLHPSLPEMVDALERQGELTLSPEVKELLLPMSPATIDRLLAPARRKPRRGLSTTKPGTLLKQAIPVHTLRR